ncbi:MAG: DUF2062 domain-containing protein [Magnetococcus sp. DMHC-6]
MNGTQDPSLVKRNSSTSSGLGWWWRWSVVQTKKHLIRPMLIGHHPPEYTAWGSAVGLIIAMTPTVGFQISMVMAVWGAVRFISHKWDFNPTVACAWTFVTNVGTVPPVYYLFLVTGREMIEIWERLSGLSAAQISSNMEAANGSFMHFEASWDWFIDLMIQYGWPLMLGCIPWALLSGWLGYVLTLRFLRRHLERKRLRLAKKTQGL